MELQELVERIQRWKQRTSGQSVGAPDDGLVGEEQEEENQVQDSETTSEEEEDQLSITENIMSETADELYAEVSAASILATEEPVDEETINVEGEEPQQPVEQEEEADSAIEGETDSPDEGSSKATG